MPLYGLPLRSPRRRMMDRCDVRANAYFRRIIGSRALSFARTIRRRRAPERDDGHWGLAAGARPGAIRAGYESSFGSEAGRLRKDVALQNKDATSPI